nr:hypothetical protein ISGA_1306 [Gordonia sp. NB41Y]
MEDELTLWIVDYVAGARGCPVVLKGELDRRWEWDAFAPTPPMGEIPSEYVLTTRHPVIDLDYWGINWLASERFLQICRDFGIGVHPVPVQIIQSGGTPTVKPYSYLRWSEWASVIDLEASSYEADKIYPSGEPAYHKHFQNIPVLESVERFVVDETKVPAAAAFLYLDLGHELVCDDDFKRACEDARLLGMGFRPITEYTKGGFWD